MTGDNKRDFAALTDAERDQLIERAEPLRASVPGVVNMATVLPERVEWLWRGRIPFGALTIIEGDPGTGKSTLTLDIAARLSNGTSMPITGEAHEPATALLLSAEDDPARTIQPRLRAAGADLELCELYVGEGDGLPEIPRDVGKIGELVRLYSARLVLIDPLAAYLGDEINSHRNQHIRRALAPMATLAVETGAAIVLVRHLNKGSGGPAIYRGGGSIGIIGAARTAHVVAKHPDDDNRRVIACVKNNLARAPRAVSFDIDDRGETSAIRWGEETDISADSIVGSENVGSPGRRREEASEFARVALQDGPIASKEFEARAHEAGVSKATLRRACDDLGVGREKRGTAWFAVPPPAPWGST